MGQTADWASIRETLETSVCTDPTVEFVVAFGSRVAGESDPGSDIDIAVKFAEECSSHDRFERRCFLSGALQHDDAPFVDVSDIERLPLEVAHDAVSGEFVCGDDRAFERFADDVTKRFEERKVMVRRQQRDLIDRIAEDGLHG